MNYDAILNRLAKSAFRSHFHLKDADKQYIMTKTWPVIAEHAATFIEKRLAPAVIYNDGKQTPMKGHPVFIAQHATATCCRSCLAKWHHIAPGHLLTPAEQDYIVGLIIAWLQREIDFKSAN